MFNVASTDKACHCCVIGLGTVNRKYRLYHQETAMGTSITHVENQNKPKSSHEFLSENAIYVNCDLVKMSVY